VDKALAGLAGFENVRRRDIGIFLAQRLVVMRAGKDKGRHERAGADSGDHRVVRSFTGGGEAAEEPGAEGAILAAAGQNEPRAWPWRQRIVEVRIGIDPKARSRNSRDAGDRVLRS